MDPAVTQSVLTKLTWPNAKSLNQKSGEQQQVKTFFLGTINVSYEEMIPIEL